MENRTVLETVAYLLSMTDKCFVPGLYPRHHSKRYFKMNEAKALPIELKDQGVIFYGTYPY